MRHHLITAACLVAAVALYIVGVALPATILFVLGIFAEFTFWFRLFRGKRGQANNNGVAK